MLDTNQKHYCVTDNAKNMVAAMRFLEMEPLVCFAHTIQLALNDAKAETPGFSNTMKKVRTIIGHYKHSSKATERLRTISKARGHTFLELLQDCKTRWNSEYLMLERLLYTKAIVNDDIINEENIDNLTSNEWKIIVSYVKMLKPLYDATTEVSAERLPTASMVRPIIFGLQNALLEFIQTKGNFGITLAKQLALTTKTRFEEFIHKDVYTYAMLLDARFKGVVLKDHEKLFYIDKLLKLTLDLPPIQLQNEPKCIPTAPI